MEFRGTFSYLDGGTSFSLAEIERRASELRALTSPGSSVELRGATTLEVLEAIVGLEGHSDTIILAPEGVQPLDHSDDTDATTPATRWVLYTSGSAGEPKPVAHTLSSLARGVRESDGERVWGLVYDPLRLAGMAVLLQALASGSRLVEARHGSIGSRVDTMRNAGVTAVSATPTLWRQILQSGRATGWALDRITLGGEVSDQLLLDSLAQQFVGARITHVFAASESGVAFSVGDGREGFPLSYLSDPPRGVALDVRDGVLWVHSPESALAGADGFVSTDDVIELREDRALFAGRLSGMANVGGTKVFPEQVERVIRQHPHVADVVVTAKKNPFSGQILVAQVEARDGASDSLAKELRTWASERMSTPMVPAQFTIVDELARSATGKVTRA